MVSAAFLIMVLGMTGVGVFLLTLVGLMRLLTWLAPAGSVAAAIPRRVGSADRDHVAVIAAAIRAYEVDEGIAK